MKRFLITSVIMLAFSASWAQHVLSDNITINKTTPVHKGDSLYFNMTIDASKLDLPSHQELILTPELKSVDGSKDLNPLIIQGRNKYKSNKRNERLSGRKSWENAYAIVRLKNKEIGNIGYKYALPYEHWMEAAIVTVKVDRIGCANCAIKERITNRIADSILGKAAQVEKPSDILFVSYVAPKAEAVKNRDKSGSAFLDFKAGKSDISADFKNNLNELTKIQEAVFLIKNNKNATINAIKMTGFASPEGRYKTNERLSASRAMALKNYMQTKYDLKSSLFNVNSVAEDWDGLKAKVEQSDLDHKSSVLSIINDNALAPDAKEAKLKKLPGGTYKILLEGYFPLLRRVEYTVKYTIRAFSVEEGKTVIKTNPGELSLNEMFLVANTFPKNSADFKDIFDVAVKMYPDDLTANLNAGANSLERNDLVGAHSYLDKLIEFPDAWNNIGVLAYKEGKFDQARTLFLKAEKEGSAEAVKNMGIMKQKDEYDAMRKHARTVAEKRAKVK